MKIQVDLDNQPYVVTALNRNLGLVPMLMSMRRKSNLNVNQATDTSGLVHPHLRDIETGKILPKVATLVKLLDTYGYQLEIRKKDEN